MNNSALSPVAIERATEQLRQERETFNQAKQHEGRWFVLRLVMGYSAVVLLGAVMLVASYILFNAAAFPAGVVTAAGAALFVGVGVDPLSRRLYFDRRRSLHEQTATELHA